MGPKISYLGIIRMELGKTIVIFEISNLNFGKKMNCGTESAFSKGPGSTLCENLGLDLRLGPLYDVCYFRRMTQRNKNKMSWVVH